MNAALCDRFPALSPFSVRRERWHEVLLIYRRLLTLRMPGAEQVSAGTGEFEHNGTVWKPASSDDWW